MDQPIPNIAPKHLAMESSHKESPDISPENLPHPPEQSSNKILSALRSRWTTLYKQTLPQLARSSHPSQAHWPVHLDHCFARIILDAIIGNSASTGTVSSPWTECIPSPAVQNMTAQQLQACIQLGEAIAAGSADLVKLDQQSLAARGKLKSQKRKSDSQGAAATMASKKKKTKTITDPNNHQQTEIRSAMGLSVPSSSSTSFQPSPPAAPIPQTLASRIRLHPKLTPFRRSVLLALCQVPCGQVTTYQALSNFLQSSPRAVGNALRNNPLAPTVPCHRVVAADMSIGGFGGGWGVEGRFYKEKVALLKGEGVVVGQGGRVGGRVWEGFVQLGRGDLVKKLEDA